MSLWLPGQDGTDDRIHFDGQVFRALGHFATDPETRPQLATTTLPDLPESEWKEFSLKQGIISIKDQGQYGACNPHAGAESLELKRVLSGQEYQELSAWFIYSILCNGVDRGSNIADCLTLLKSKGTCLDANVAHGTISPRKLTAENYTEGNRFKIEIGVNLVTFNDLMIATQLNLPFNFSIHVGNNFTLDSNGVVGFSRGMGNHAVCGGFGAKKLPTGEWVLEWQNSWKASWGINGRAFFTKRHIEEQTYFEAYTVESAIDDPDDTTLPVS